MKYITLIYPEKAKRIEYTDHVNLVRQLHADFRKRGRVMHDEYPGAIMRYPCGEYRLVTDVSIERVVKDILSDSTKNINFGMKMNARAAIRALMRLKYYYYRNKYEQIVYLAHAHEAFTGHYLLKK